MPEGGYSAALQAWDGVWSHEDLNAFLWQPKIAVPGVLMEFPGLEDAAERADVIACLRSLSDKPVPRP